MKMIESHYNALRHGIIEVLLYNNLLENAKENTFTSANMWEVFWTAMDDIQYDNHHPRYKFRSRIVYHIPGFADDFDYKDAHIQTALNQIFGEISTQEFHSTEVIAQTIYLKFDNKLPCKLIYYRDIIKIGNSLIRRYGAHKETETQEIYPICPCSQHQMRVESVYMKKLTEACNRYQRECSDHV